MCVLHSLKCLSGVWGNESSGLYAKLLLFPTKGTSCCWAWHGRTASRRLLQYTSTVFGFCIIMTFILTIYNITGENTALDWLKGTVSSTIDWLYRAQMEHWTSCLDTENYQTVKSRLVLRVIFYSHTGTLAFQVCQYGHVKAQVSWYKNTELREA